MPSTTDQLIKCFGDIGEIAIYFRPTDQPEIMLASTEPITQKVYETWLKEEEDKWRDL